MIFVTGDTHGCIDIHKLTNKNFPQNRELTKDDYVIVAGDFGLVWDGREEDKYWLKWLQNRNFTTLFVDGNHENFDLLDLYPVAEWNGGKVHFINDSVIHLMRGQVYNLQGHTFFTFGGASSSDKEFRKEGKSWWGQEIPSEAEYKEGICNLEKHGFAVDYIITHTCPASTLRIVKEKYNKTKPITEINDFLEEVMHKTQYGYWFSGHDHVDDSVVEKHRIVYREVIKII